MAELQRSSVLCFKKRCWIASLNEMWSQGKGGEVVGEALELQGMSNAEGKSNS